MRFGTGGIPVRFIKLIMGSIFNIDRIARGSLHIKNLCVSVFGGIQPELLERYLAGMSYAEIAAVIGGTVDAARRAAADGQKKLRTTHTREELS